jgi:hypothetical protein
MRYIDGIRQVQVLVPCLGPRRPLSHHGVRRIAPAIELCVAAAGASSAQSIVAKHFDPARATFC